MISLSYVLLLTASSSLVSEPFAQAANPACAAATRLANSEFSSGDRVRSLVAHKSRHPWGLKIGHEGTITGPAAPPDDLQVEFDGDPPLLVSLEFTEVCKPDEYEKRMAPLAAAGYSVGDGVRSLVTLGHWQPRDLGIGDFGQIVGLAAPPEDVMVEFCGDPPIEGGLELSDICKGRSCDSRFAADHYGFRVGETVMSLVETTDLHPRQIKMGDEGRIIGPGLPPAQVQVRFDGVPTLHRHLQVTDICRPSECEQQYADLLAAREQMVRSR